VNSPTVLDFKLEAITSIHVWDGERRLIGLDVVPLKSEACIVDIEKIDVNKIGVVPSSYQKFEESIRNWIETGIMDCSRKIPLNATPRKAEEVKLLPPLYIPASSLKGYIRTALLYHLLMEAASTQGKQAVASLLLKLVNLSSKPEVMGREVESVFMARPRFGKQGGSVDMLQQLHLAEPKAIKASSSINRAVVIDVNGNLVADPLLEVLLPGSTLEYQIRIPPLVSQNSVRIRGKDAGTLSQIIQLYNNLTPQLLSKALSEFGRAQLEHELDRVKKVSQSLASKGFDLSAYKDALELLASDKCIPVRLGFATSHVSKTILLAVDQVAPNLSQQVRSTMSKHVGRTWDELTFKLVNMDRRWLGLGWAKLCTT